MSNYSERKKNNNRDVNRVFAQQLHGFYQYYGNPIYYYFEQFLEIEFCPTRNDYLEIGLLCQQ